MLSRLNGMFAFAIWDKLEKKLVLVRDRMGLNLILFFVLMKPSILPLNKSPFLQPHLSKYLDGLRRIYFNRFVAGKTHYIKTLIKSLDIV
jgi:asparagine synthase (glutamine-hydrolysing)